MINCENCVVFILITSLMHFAVAFLHYVITSPVSLSGWAALCHHFIGIFMSQTQAFLANTNHLL